MTGSEHLHHNYASFIDEEHPNHDPSYGEIVRDYYRHLDSKPEKFYGKMGEDTNLIVVSDHGFAPSYGVVHLNKILENKGYFEGKVKRSISQALFNFAEESGLANRLRNSVDFDLLGLLPESLGKFVKSGRGEKIDADWSNTEAFCSGIMGDIRINLEGRESEGVVDRDDYERVREEIIQILEEDRRVSKFVDGVYKKEDLFNGPCLQEIPDLFVKFKKQVVSSAKVDVDSVYTPERDLEGFHTMQGVFMAYGPDMKSSENKLQASIMDVAPTVLHMMGHKIPRDMDGRVLDDIFEEGGDPEKRGVEYREGEGRKYETSDEDEGKVKERLKELGYID